VKETKAYQGCCVHQVIFYSVTKTLFFLGRIIIILTIPKYDYDKRDWNGIYSLEEMAVTNQKIGELLTRIPKGSVSLRYLETQFNQNILVDNSR
jgi:hypothetical protein